MILGAAQLGMKYGVANDTGRLSKEEVFAILDTAREYGVCLIDTAEAYGDSESVIADYLKMYPESFGVCTKISLQSEILSAESVVDAVKKRREALGVARLECIYLHRFEDCKHAEIISGLLLSKENGLVDSIGVSIYFPEELHYIVENLASEIDVVQLPLNILSLSDWEEDLEAATRAGITLYARSVYLQGLLLMDAESSPVRKLGAEGYITRLCQLSDAAGVSKKMFCMGSVIGTYGIQDVVVGCDNLAQLLENLSLEREVCTHLDGMPKFAELEHVPGYVTNPSRWPEFGVGRHVVAIIQARMGSSRLPQKILADIGGIPMLERIVQRVKRAALIDEVVVATTDSCIDDPVATFCEQSGIEVFRGSEQDVLDRYYRCAQAYNADIVVRLTADNPFVDPEIIDSAVHRFCSEGNLDYLRYCEQLPLGMKIEVVDEDALESAWKDASDLDCREHVTPFLYRNPQLFRTLICDDSSRANGADLRLTVDTEEDLATARNLYGVLPKDFSYEHVLVLAKQQPQLFTNGQISQKNITYEGEAV